MSSGFQFRDYWRSICQQAFTHNTKRQSHRSTPAVKVPLHLPGLLPEPKLEECCSLSLAMNHNQATTLRVRPAAKRVNYHSDPTYHQRHFAYLTKGCECIFPRAILRMDVWGCVSMGVDLFASFNDDRRQTPYCPS